MKVYLMAHTPNPEQVIASAAKLCYSNSSAVEILEKMSDEDVSKFITNLIDMGHESPLEHTTWTFSIEGISRNCSHQLVRHRLASTSQQSQRYVRNNNFEVVTPKDIEDTKFAKVIFDEAVKTSQLAYEMITNELIYAYAKKDGHLEEYKSFIKKEEINNNELTEAYDFLQFLKEHKKNAYRIYEKKAIENARYVLVSASETKLVETMNTRELLHFFTLRCCDRAQEEIRELANEMLRVVKEVSPILFKNAGPSCVRGKCSEGSMSCGNPRKERV